MCVYFDAELEKDLFPDTLQGFGYEFNSEGQWISCNVFEDCQVYAKRLNVGFQSYFVHSTERVLFSKSGQLRRIDTKEPFNFEVKPGDRAFNQKHCEALGEVSMNIFSNYL